MKSVKSFKPSKLVKKTKSCITLDNIVGLVLALLILFEFKVENNLKALIKSPIGMLLSLILLVIMFVFMNPMVGLLFLIYLYEVVKDTPLHPATYVNNVMSKQNVMNNLNQNNAKKNSDKVEIDVIRNMAPIVRKRESSKALFVSHTNDPIPFNKV